MRQTIVVDVPPNIDTIRVVAVLKDGKCHVLQEVKPTASAIVPALNQQLSARGYASRPLQVRAESSRLRAVIQVLEAVALFFLIVTLLFVNKSHQEQKVFLDGLINTPTTLDHDKLQRDSQ